MYWAEALANQNDDNELKKIFAPVAKELKDNEEKILSEIIAAEGKPTDIGGYYLPDEAKTEKAMRPSTTFNSILEKI